MDIQPDDQQPAQEHGDAMTTAAADAGPIQEVESDLFDAPEGSGLIHACNIEGTWGAGIALRFKKMYPAAYQFYRNHCQEFVRAKQTHKIPELLSDREYKISVPMPLGTALIIPPQAGDARRGMKKQWIICLFTSRGYGARADRPEFILSSTNAALQDLKEKLIDLQLDGTEPSPNALYSCRFNAGLFGVPWHRTKAVMEDAGLRVTVMAPQWVVMTDSGCTRIGF